MSSIEGNSGEFEKVCARLPEPCQRFLEKLTEIPEEERQGRLLALDLFILKGTLVQAVAPMILRMLEGEKIIESCWSINDEVRDEYMPGYREGLEDIENVHAELLAEHADSPVPYLAASFSLIATLSFGSSFLAGKFEETDN